MWQQVSAGPLTSECITLLWLDIDKAFQLELGNLGYSRRHDIFWPNVEQILFRINVAAH